jgi:CubicO group peptidase (beta-lactamase class C family)
MNPKTPRKEWLNAIGLAAKQLCSLVFVSGFEPGLAKSLYIDPVLAPFNLDLAINYDTSSRQVTVSIFDSWSATARMREGLGCTLITNLKGDDTLPEVQLPKVVDKPLSYMTNEELGNKFNEIAFEEAINCAFAPENNTLAVVVLHRGRIARERYAPDIDASTVRPGWSMAKSITATLVGVLVKQGRLDINKIGAVQEWRHGVDSGQLVTLDHLLRMTSGLDLLEDQSGADPNSRMLFVEQDAAAFAVKRGLRHPPGTHWAYMSGSSVLACRAIFHAVGGTLETSQRFYREALWKPLGASSFTLETDAAGTFIGSSFALANAHDWAKFGQLYLNNGIWEGERLLPERWVDYVTRHTTLSGENSYGSGFWTVEHSNLEDLPADTFYGNGFQGQYVIIVPSHDLVVVRLGASLGPIGVWQLLRGLVAALK